MTTFEQLQERIEELERENAELRHNPAYDTLTRQALVIEHRKIAKLTGEHYVVMIDIDFLHELNEFHGSQEPVNAIIRRAFNFRDDDLLMKGNYASGDEIAWIVRSDPDGFMSRLSESLISNGLSATMAWERIENDDLLAACERAIQKVYAAKKERGSSGR